MEVQVETVGSGSVASMVSDGYFKAGTFKKRISFAEKQVTLPISFQKKVLLIYSADFLLCEAKMFSKILSELF